MHDIKRIAFLINDPQDTWEGLRSTLGLLVENMWAAAFFIDCELSPPASKTKADFEENLEMLVDLEGEAYSNVAANADNYENITYLPLAEMIEKIKTYQLVVPF